MNGHPTLWEEPEAEVAPVLDLAEGRRRRDEGMARASARAPSAWAQAVDRLIEELEPGTVFTAEELRAAGEPHHPNAWGPRLAANRRRGLIEPAGQAQARRPERHANRMSVWRRL